jgi:acyl carrier protein
MNNKEQLLIIINEVLEGKGSTKIKSIFETDKLRDDIGLDSFDLAELTVRVEEAFDVDIFEDGIIEVISEILNKINGK